MSKMPATQDVVYSIQVAVSAESAKYLDANRGDKSASDKLAGYVRWFIDRQARGGMMIEPEQMSHLASLNKGRRFETSRDVVKAVEIALERREGQYSFTVAVDPTLVMPLEECAQFQGLTAQQLLEMIVNQVMTNGWCYEFVPENGRMLPLSESDVATLQRLTGSKNFTAAEVIAKLALQENQAQAKVA